MKKEKELREVENLQMIYLRKRICCRASEKNYGIFKKLWHRSTGCGSKYRRREIQGSNHSGQRDHSGNRKEGLQMISGKNGDLREGEYSIQTVRI